MTKEIKQIEEELKKAEEDLAKAEAECKEFSKTNPRRNHIGSLGVACPRCKASVGVFCSSWFPHNKEHKERDKLAHDTNLSTAEEHKKTDPERTKLNNAVIGLKNVVNKLKQEELIQSATPVSENNEVTMVKDCRDRRVCLVVRSVRNIVGLMPDDLFYDMSVINKLVDKGINVVVTGGSHESFAAVYWPEQICRGFR